MEISNPPPIPQLATLILSTPDIKSWQTGQILSALVAKVTPQGNMTLQIGDTTIEVNSGHINTAPGQTLMLEVMRTEPQTLLKIVNQPASSQPLTEVPTEALKVLLPRQMPLPPLLANLALLARDNGRTLPVLPHNVDVIIKKLVNDLPTENKLSSADGLKRALSLSGMFLENKLASAGNTNESGSIDQDLKANLLRLLSNLQQISPSLTPRNLSPNPSAQPNGPQSMASNPASSASAGPKSTALTPDANTNIKPGVSPSLSPRINPGANANINSGTNLTTNLTANPGTTPATAANTNPRANPTGNKYAVDQPLFKHSAPPLLPQTPLQAQERTTASVSGQQSPPQIIEELAQQVNGAIARLQIHQVASLPTEDNLYPALSFELPLQHENRIDVIQVRIYQDRTSKTSEKPDRWSASLAMDLESLGAVYATITISQHQVWTSLWAETKSTAEIINQHLQELYKGYNKVGLNVGTTHCCHGTPPPSVRNPHKVLVDTNV